MKDSSCFPKLALVWDRSFYCARPEESEMEHAKMFESHQDGGSLTAHAFVHNMPSERDHHFSSHSSPRKAGRRALLFGMGGTLLSGLGFVALALFEQYNGMLSELRQDLKHFNEVSSEFAKKDSLQRLREQLFKDHIKEMQDAAVIRTQLDMELKASEKARDELARELQRMRERMAYIEGRHSAAQASPNQDSKEP